LILHKNKTKEILALLTACNIYHFLSKISKYKMLLLELVSIYNFVSYMFNAQISKSSKVNKDKMKKIIIILMSMKLIF
jgi:hypothetical protein